MAPWWIYLLLQGCSEHIHRSHSLSKHYYSLLSIKTNTDIQKDSYNKMVCKSKKSKNKYLKRKYIIGSF